MKLFHSTGPAYSISSGKRDDRKDGLFGKVFSLEIYMENKTFSFDKHEKSPNLLFWINTSNFNEIHFYICDFY